MKNKRFVLIVSALILFSAIVLRINDYLKKDEKIVELELNNDDIVLTEKEEDLEPEIFINIIEPVENELISSPYKIRGLISNYLFNKFDYYFILINNEEEIDLISQLKAVDNSLEGEIISFYTWLEFEDLKGNYKLSLRKKNNDILISTDILDDITINIR